MIVGSTREMKSRVDCEEVYRVGSPEKIPVLIAGGPCKVDCGEIYRIDCGETPRADWLERVDCGETEPQDWPNIDVFPRACSLGLGVHACVFWYSSLYGGQTMEPLISFSLWNDLFGGGNRSAPVLSGRVLGASGTIPGGVTGSCHYGVPGYTRTQYVWHAMYFLLSTVGVCATEFVVQTISLG